MRSFVFPQLGVDPVKNGTLKLPKIGLVRFRQSRPIPDGATIKQARIVHRASGWYVMLTLQWDVSVPSVMPHSEALGVDVGLTNFLATSNGLLVKRQKFFLDAESKLKLLQKSVSRKKIGSNNWIKLRRKSPNCMSILLTVEKTGMEIVSSNLSRCRDDFRWGAKSSRMLSRAMLWKHCLDATWGQFFTILEQACFKYGVYFQKVNANKTSQTCPNCG